MTNVLTIRKQYRMQEVSVKRIEKGPALAGPDLSINLNLRAHDIPPVHIPATAK